VTVPAAARKEIIWRMAFAGKSKMLISITEEFANNKIAIIQARISNGTGMNTILLLLHKNIN